MSHRRPIHRRESLVPASSVHPAPDEGFRFGSGTDGPASGRRGAAARRLHRAAERQRAGAHAPDL